MIRQLWIPVPPKVKQRPRMGRGRRVFTPEQTIQYENEIRDVWRREIGEQFPADVLLAVDITYTRDGTLLRISESPEPRVPVGLGRGDLDNYVKATLDGLQGDGGAFVDDKSVVELAARKRPQGAELLLL